MHLFSLGHFLSTVFTKLTHVNAYSLSKTVMELVQHWRASELGLRMEQGYHQPYWENYLRARTAFDSLFHLAWEPGWKFLFFSAISATNFSLLQDHSHIAVIENISLEHRLDHLSLLPQKLHSSHKIEFKTPERSLCLLLLQTEVHPLLKLNWTSHCFPSMACRTSGLGIGCSLSIGCSLCQPAPSPRSSFQL